ncbi:ATP-binding cassette domain-containing protein [Nakamurella sp. YIM 132087]|uniref:ATP-binding cassette domain-containing protein n=1 Tax=Nakamurella alba TaxID=2665158 RepID=A0A7K1FRE4_9ACTN|nr:ATP-binding cassette domain-containing protein [Nakamurella alba]
MLQVKDLDAGYGSVPVLRQVSVQVRRGETVALLGSNGAGKSTLLRAISGMIPVFGGSVEFQGSPLRGVAPQKIARRGLCHVPEGRRLFAKQTVQDNLLLGMYGIRLTRAEEQERIDGALAIFPALTTRLADYAGFLSGGQQQMLAVALALVRQPDLIMLDEPSLGLAPVIIDEVFEALSEVSRRGGTVLLVEQLATRALRLADRAYVLAHGRITAEGSAEELLAGETLAAAYLGDTH